MILVWRSKQSTGTACSRTNSETSHSVAQQTLLFINKIMVSFSRILEQSGFLTA